jgi:RDD family
MEWLNKGQSLGKMVMKIRVIGIDGNVPTASQCATRWMFNAVDTWLIYLFVFMHQYLAFLGIFSPFIGAIVIGTSKKQQRLGDMAARTLVVSTKENEVGIFDTIYAYAVKKNNYQPKFPEIMRLPDKDITLIKSLMERADDTYDYELAHRLAAHIKKVLKIESKNDDSIFLKQLLEDYNYYSVNEENFVKPKKQY